MRYEFAAFILDVNEGQLRRGGERIPLRPKCFDLLVYLLRSRGKLLTKNDLLDNVWPDAVVSEATLSRTVATLRAALDDSPQKPALIETASRRGYRFIGQVREVDEQDHRSTDYIDRSTDYILVYKNHEYSLRDGSQLIGRGRDVQIPVFTTGASRHHARLVVAGHVIHLEDLESRNGTFVNGKRVSGTVEIGVGDEIEIGGETLILWSPSAETPAAPERMR